MIAKKDRLESTPKTLMNEPIEKTLPNEPMDPIEKAEPIDPMDMKDLWEAMDQVDCLGERNGALRAMPLACHTAFTRPVSSGDGNRN